MNTTRRHAGGVPCSWVVGVDGEKSRRARGRAAAPGAPGAPPSARTQRGTERHCSVAHVVVR
eukprot:6530616-Prymnesium_polylepis.1